jgi:hypothetical protein
MANDIGSVRGVTGVSTSLNNQSGAGGQKPAVASSSTADKGCKPPKAPEGSVPMPK